MRVSFWLSGVLSFFVVFTSTAGAVSNSGVRGPKYQKIRSELYRLTQEFPGLATFYNYGKSVRNQDLTMIKVQSRNALTSRAPAVVITGATHGNEYLGVVDRLPRWILENAYRDLGVRSFLNRGGAVYLVPIFNPDGYEQKKRQNSNAQDLNRDFDIPEKGERRFKQPETRSFTEFLEQDLGTHQLELKLTMDYHCCKGAWLHPDESIGAAAEEQDVQQHADWANAFTEFFQPGYLAGGTFDILRYRTQGTSKDYYFSRYGALAFTFEGKYRKESKNLPSHQRMWSWILRKLAE